MSSRYADVRLTDTRNICINRPARCFDIKYFPYRTMPTRRILSNAVITGLGLTPDRVGKISWSKQNILRLRL